MKRDLDSLTQSTFDLVVIGGGIFGACASWDAAQRGLSVALIERDDFGGATSANSYKIVHGGIRYIQHFDVFRVRQSSNERRAFLRVAPHLVHPLPIVIPTYGHGMKGRSVLRVGMGLYDLLTADRNRGIADPDRKVPWGRSMGRGEALELFPGLDPDGLTGAAVFCDGHMYNPPRLVLAFVQQAVEAGAVAANHVEAIGFLREGDRVIGVKARDAFTGSSLDIRAKVVLNAAGPYAEHLLIHGADLKLSPPGVYSRDACFVVPRRLLQNHYALAVQGKTRDPEAVFSRGERHLFLAPWRDYTVVGTWHVVYRGDPNSFTVTDDELQRFIDEVNAAYPRLQLTIDDVSIWNAGLVPFGENPEGAEHLRYGHRSRLIDHSETDGIANFITLIGVRYTTGRYEAERAVDMVFRKLGFKSAPCRTATTPIAGGDIPNWADFLAEAKRKHSDRYEDAVIESLAHNYGSRYGRVVALAEAETGLASPIGKSSIIKAAVLHAVRHEMAETLGDVVFRRTDLATGDYPGRAALREAVDVLAAERPMSSGEIEHQLDGVAARFPERVVRRVDRGAAGAVA